LQNTSSVDAGPIIRKVFDGLRARGNALLASARFRRWAAAFPLTRPIAQRRARQLFDLCAGFVYSQILYACVRLQLFEMLAEGPLSTAALSQRLDLPINATSRLLNAAVSLRLLALAHDGRFCLGALGAPMAGNEAIKVMIEHHAMLYADLRDPVALLREGPRDSELGRYWAYARFSGDAELQPAQVAGYSALMSASQPLVAEEILDAYPLRQHRCLLDVGGGEAKFLSAVAAHAPHLRLMLFDLPAVAERARHRLAALGLAARSEVHGGSFHADVLPAGADIISLVRVIHDHDDAVALALLRNVRRALPQGGVVLIAEPMSATRGAEPIGDAYFGFYLWAMGSGQARTPVQHGALLESAGFERIRLIPTRMPLQTRVMIAVAK